ncbi:MAG TPA: NlpC/P60 family protein [Alphaproteobacteria bacterium]|nr:phage tail protein [Rhodospirillaceae bacterium]HRJ66792.1 NlpC/P60 family protein [Alphaproteobacteria bacterium]
MPVPIWAGRYIGLPFRDHGRDRSGLDCWGLVRLVMAEQFSIALPSLAAEYEHTLALDDISGIIRRQIPAWQEVPQGHETCGDVVVLRLHGLPLHVGVVLGDGYMLDVEARIDSAIEKYDQLRWKDRLYGFYRHRAAQNAAAPAG